MVAADSQKAVDTNRGLDVQYPVCDCAIDFLPGVTLGAGIRRRPNAFNLLYQLEFLRRTGLSKEHSVAALQACGGLL